MTPDLIRFRRNSALAARVTALVPNSPGAIRAIKNALRSYRVSESAARDLILTVWNILDCNLDGTASIVNALIDLIDDEEKKNNLLAAWNGFKIEVCPILTSFTTSGSCTNISTETFGVPRTRSDSNRHPVGGRRQRTGSQRQTNNHDALFCPILKADPRPCRSCSRFVFLIA